MSERKPKQGRKLSQAELKKVKSQNPVATSKEDAEVEGQYIRCVPVC